MLCLCRRNRGAAHIRLWCALAATLLSLAMLPQLIAEEEPSPEDSSCLACHGSPDLWEGDTLHLKVTAEDLSDDIHWKRGLRCHDCHGGNSRTTEFREAHAAKDGFRRIGGPQDVPEFCGHCHSNLEYMRKYNPGITVDYVADFSRSAHGKFLRSKPTDPRAVNCSSCHPKHASRAATDPASATHVSHIVETCGTCHKSIKERLNKSVHGQGGGPGRAIAKSAREGNLEPRAGCTDCHPGHDLQDPASVAFRNQQPNRCGNCHSELSTRYAESVHGELTHLGYGPAAKCADCHGSHGVLPASNPASRLSAKNRLQTCRKCHPTANANFVSFDPHADHRDRAKSPVLFWTYTGLLIFISAVFGVFGVHSILWFGRGLVDVAQQGRARQLRHADAAYIRFQPHHRIAHSVMVVSFLGLALTGLPLKFSDYEWGRQLAGYLGGFGFTSVLHRLFSITTFGCFLGYAFLLLRHYRRGRRQGMARRDVIFGPDSPLPNLRDLKDFTAMIRWFIGRGPRPTFERWAYWEKFDFWGACSDIILIGVTGLVLWFPVFFCQFLPGEIVNVAKVIHSTLAMLATGFVFAIHFFGTHFRPDKFPMDMSVLTGLVSAAELQHERPEYLERMRREGKIEEITSAGPSRVTLWIAWLLGMVALIIGLGLLAGILYAAFV